MAALIDRTENPSLPIRAQRNSQFNFDQQINMSVVGQVGEKLEITANFDSNNSFDFENNFRVEYTGFEEEIIKKIEVGNVNLPVRNSLMSGAQSLFGVKTQLQFGRLFITGVATTQRGETDAIEIEGGSQSSTFAIRASDYDENRHFFLGHFFRDHYGIEPGDWLNRLPQITSGVNITRMEVYVINRNNDTQTLRNVAAFMDLGEGEAENLRMPANPFIAPLAAPVTGSPNYNDANALFDNLQINDDLRNLDNIDRELQALGFNNSTDYVVLKSARKLDEREYTYHPSLGYLSLNRRLQSDEALAVAYEYTYNGKRYQVGELSENYQDRPASDLIFMKILRPNKIATDVPSLGPDDEKHLQPECQPGKPRGFSAAHYLPRRPHQYRQPQPAGRGKYKKHSPGTGNGARPPQPGKRPAARRELRLCRRHYHSPRKGKHYFSCTRAFWRAFGRAVS